MRASGGRVLAATARKPLWIPPPPTLAPCASPAQVHDTSFIHAERSAALQKLLRPPPSLQPLDLELASTLEQLSAAASKRAWLRSLLFKSHPNDAAPPAAEAPASQAVRAPSPAAPSPAAAEPDAAKPMDPERRPLGELARVLLSSQAEACEAAVQLPMLRYPPLPQSGEGALSTFDRPWAGLAAHQHCRG